MLTMLMPSCSICSQIPFDLLGIVGTGRKPASNVIVGLQAQDGIGPVVDPNGIPFGAFQPEIAVTNGNELVLSRLVFRQDAQLVRNYVHDLSIFQQLGGDRIAGRVQPRRLPFKTRPCKKPRNGYGRLLGKHRRPGDSFLLGADRHPNRDRRVAAGHLEDLGAEPHRLTLAVGEMLRPALKQEMTAGHSFGQLDDRGRRGTIEEKGRIVDPHIRHDGPFAGIGVADQQGNRRAAAGAFLVEGFDEGDESPLNPVAKPTAGKTNLRSDASLGHAGKDLFGHNRLPRTGFQGRNHPLAHRPCSKD